MSDDKKQFDIETRLGPVTVRPWEGKRVYVRFRDLTAFGVKYNGNCTLQDYGAGLELRREKPEDPRSTWSALSASRADNICKNASEPARKTIQAELIRRVRLWAAENPIRFLEADEESAKQVYGRALDSLQESERGLLEAKENCVKTKAALVAAKKALDNARKARG